MRAIVAAFVCFLGLLGPTPAHAALLDRLLPFLSGSLRTQGLSISWGGTLTADTVELLDTKGTYATFHGVKIVWSPLALIHGNLTIDSLTADDGDVARLPASSGSSGSGLPSTLAVKQLAVSRLALEQSLIGAAANLRVSGFGSRDASGAQGQLNADRLDVAGTYSLSGKSDAAGLDAHLAAKEASGGLIATAAGLPAIGAIDLTASVSGPETALATAIALQAGKLRAGANGQIDMISRTLTLQMNASAPAMAPRPDLSWQSVALQAAVKGAFTAPDIAATVHADGVQVAGGGVRTAALDVSGNQGDIHLTGQFDGVTVPGKEPDILAATPLRLEAEAKLSAPERPVTFALHHPILQASGTATIDTERGSLDLTLPDLAPFAAEAGEALQGRAALHLAASRAPAGANDAGAIAADLNGSLSITGGKAPVPALVGENATIAVAAQVQGSTVTLSHLAFDGKDLVLSGNGTLSSQAVDLSFAAALAQLAPVDPRLNGGLRTEGRVSGPSTKLSLAATITGDVGLEGQSSGPFTARLAAQGLPNAPSGSLTAQGALLGSPVDIAMSGSRTPDGGLRAQITRADWKSLAASGAVALPVGATLPQGQLSLTIGRLADFAPLIGRPLTGSIAATLDASSAATWRVDAQAKDAGEAGLASVAKAALRVTLDHPDHDPAVNGMLDVDGLRTGTVSGSARLAASGPASALDLTASADLTNLDGAPGRVSAKGTADVPARQLTLAAFSGAWKGQDIRLLAPVRLGFAQGVSIDNLRLSLARAVIEVNGTIGQSLDLTARLRDLPVSLASLVSPSLDLAGTLNAQAKLGGTPAAPTGTVRAEATGLRLNTPTGRDLPAANLTATAELRGKTAQLDVRANAGASHLSVAGTAGLGMTAPIDLHADASIAVAQADPLLGAGTRATGRVTLAAAITGTASKPEGTIRADATGVRLLSGPGAGLPPASLTTVATLRGTSVRVDARLAAGSSRLTVAGTAGLSSDGPLDLHAGGSIDLAIADPVLQASGESVRGSLVIDANVGGTLAAPRASGGATLSGGDIRDYAAGVHLSEVSARFLAAGDVIRLVSLQARAGSGTMSATGSVGVLAPGMPIDLAITARDATPISSDLLTATLGADLSIRGQLEGAVTLGGRVFVRRAVLQVPNRLPASVVTIPVRIAGAPPPKPTAPSKLLATIGLDLTVNAPRQIYLRGRGLNAELGGTVRIGGTTQAMRTSGGFRLIRGNFNLVGNTLTFDSGDIDFNGAAITDPALHLVATSVGSNMVATLTVSGTARDPQVTLSSVPPLPQDQILAQLLFHTNAGALSPFQLAGIAAALAEISGQGGGISPLRGLQNALGLDQLGVGTGANGQATLQAGRYLTRRVYVGAQQAAGGGGAQATVQVDLTKGLKLNATVGNGETTSAIGSTGASSGASIGVTYQFQY